MKSMQAIRITIRADIWVDYSAVCGRIQTTPWQSLPPSAVSSTLSAELVSRVTWPVRLMLNVFEPPSPREQAGRSFLALIEQGDFPDAEGMLSGRLLELYFILTSPGE